MDDLFDASKGTNSLALHIHEVARQAGGWSGMLAEGVRKGIEAAFTAGKEMNAAMQLAYDKACEAVTVFEGFAKEHPSATAVFVTVIAIGVLIILAPYIVEMLGFGELGPIEGQNSMSLPRA